ncbi:MAG: metal-dependent hydrolase [Candidatus Nanohalobium sp.]
MLGRQHLMLSAATAAALAAPFIEHTGLALTFFTGACIGSLIPDVDAHDAAIFHRDLKGLNHGTGRMLNNFIGPALPFFGYTTKYLIYIPAVKFYNFLFSDYSFHGEHRSFSHSVLGIFTMTALTGVYIISTLAVLQVFIPLYVGAFLLAYMTGAFLHMLQDSCTKTGIAWNSPFSKTKLKGRLKTGKSRLKPRMFFTYLATVAGITFYLGSIPSYTLSSVGLAVQTVLLLGASWLVFMHFSGVKRER